jgi:predicted small integral membrane protein
MGYQYAGKVYFIGSIGLALVVKWWLGLFEEDSKSQMAVSIVYV